MSGTIFEIPLSGNPQKFNVTLGDSDYQLQLIYRDAPEGGWTLDISATNGDPLIMGIPCVTGADLLAQYRYIGIAGMLFFLTDGTNYWDVPTFAGLGTTSHMYFRPN